MKIGLYVHIPFCKSKCFYCDFLSFAKHHDQTEAYVEALIEELKNYGKHIAGVHTISSIFIGGGTPTVLTPFLLERVCETIKTVFHREPDCEWTIEANPGTVEKEHVEVFVRQGVNRVSLGLQACQSTLLKAIGRVHVLEDWKNTVKLLQEHGITNINTDIMFGLPEQTVKEWEETLEEVTRLDIPHLSAYSLIIEEGTVFHKRYEEGKLLLPSEEDERTMYEVAKQYLKDKGYRHYEISNWSKPGYPCNHNILYWQQGAYIGAGLGAHSYMNHTRYHNTENMKTYIEAFGNLDLLIAEKECITEKMAMEEFMFLGLRLIDGIRVKRFEERFEKSIFEIYGDVIEKWIKENLLVHHNDSIYLTERGIALSNQVFASFL